MIFEETTITSMRKHTRKSKRPTTATNRISTLKVRGFEKMFQKENTCAPHTHAWCSCRNFLPCDINESHGLKCGHHRRVLCTVMHCHGRRIHRSSHDRESGNTCPVVERNKTNGVQKHVAGSARLKRWPHPQKTWKRQVLRLRCKYDVE